MIRLYKLPPYEPLQKFGRIPDIDAGQTNEDVWDGTGAYTFPTTATAFKISSSSTNDTSAGTGAQTVTIMGLDANYDEVTQTVSMNGQTGVTIPTSLLRVYRAWVATAGSGTTNAGDIWIGTGTITDGVPANKYAGIVTGAGQTLMAIYTVPDQNADGVSFSGGVILRWYGSIGAINAAYATLALQTRASGGAWRTRRAAGVAEGGYLNEYITFGIDVAPRTDIRIRVLSNGVNNSAIEAGFDVALTRS